MAAQRRHGLHAIPVAVGVAFTVLSRAEAMSTAARTDVHLWYPDQKEGIRQSEDRAYHKEQGQRNNNARAPSLDDSDRHRELFIDAKKDRVKAGLQIAGLEDVNEAMPNDEEGTKHQLQRHDRRGLQTCAVGDSFTITSSAFPLAEGCYVASEVYVGHDGGPVYMSESAKLQAYNWRSVTSWSSSTFILEELVWGVDYWDVTVGSNFEDIMTACVSWQNSWLGFHPADASAWACDLDGDGVWAEGPTSSQFSVQCGCDTSSTLTSASSTLTSASSTLTSASSTLTSASSTLTSASAPTPSPITPTPGPIANNTPPPTPAPVVLITPRPTPAPVVPTTPQPTPTPVVPTTPQPTPTPVVSTTPQPSPTPVVPNTPQPSPTPVALVTPRPTPTPVDLIEPEATPAPFVTVTPEPTSAPVDLVMPEETPAPVASITREPTSTAEPPTADGSASGAWEPIATDGDAAVYRTTALFAAGLSIGVVMLVTSVVEIWL